MARKILIVDDDESLRTLLKARVETGGYEVRTAASGGEALKEASARLPDLILLDMTMPAMSGEEVLKRLKGDGETKHIPVIFLTARDTMVKGLELGAVDYIQKPFDSAELLARIRAQLRVKDLQDELTQLSNTDSLTGCYNRRYALRVMDAEVQRSKRSHAPLSCAMLDLDGFKKLNDTHGHEFGDFVLQQVAALMKKNVRDIDSVCRYGGDEFLLVLPDTTRAGAHALCERLCALVIAHPFRKGRITAGLGVSMGVASLPLRGARDRRSLIARADKELYKNKRQRAGRHALRRA